MKDLFNKSFNHYFVIAIMLLFVIGSCKHKAVSSDVGKDNFNNLMTNKLNSWWYYGARGDTAVRNYKRYATGTDSTVLGYKLSYFYRILDTNPLNPIPWQTAEYIGVYNVNYVTMIDLDGSQTKYLPYVFYVKGRHVGSADWFNVGDVSYQGINAHIFIVSKVTEENLTLSWQGKTFDSVTHVVSTMGMGSIYPGMKVGSLEIWFRHGVGIVKDLADINILGGVFKRFYVDSLIDYHIEQ